MNDIDIVKDFLFYNSEDESVKVQVMLDAEAETIWATQRSIAELFGVTVPNISYHFNNIFRSGELSPDMVVKEVLIPVQSGPEVCLKVKSDTIILMQLSQLDIVSIPFWLPTSEYGRLKSSRSIW